jgi:hypothetical protein
MTNLRITEIYDFAELLRGVPMQERSLTEKDFIEEYCFLTRMPLDRQSMDTRVLALYNEYFPTKTGVPQ